MKDIQEDDIIIKDSVRSIQSEFGLAQKYLSEVVGEKVRKDIFKNIPVILDFI